MVDSAGHLIDEHLKYYQHQLNDEDAVGVGVEAVADGADCDSDLLLVQSLVG